jgi:hypothetical protein
LINRVGGLQERTLDVVLARNGLRRRHWHVLQALAGGPLTRAQIAEAMLPFRVAAAVTQTDVADDLVRRDWVASDGVDYRLTADGTAAHLRIAEQVRALHVESVRGIAAAELRTALEVLARIASNLEATLGP